MRQNNTVGNRMSEQECIDKILETERPLMIARLALDCAYDEASHEITGRRRAGESLMDMMGEDFAVDTEAHTRKVLATYGPERPDTGYHDVFMLRATLEAARPQRLFMFDAFSRHTSREVRQMLKRDACRSNTKLLAETLDLWSGVAPEQRPGLVSAIDDLSLVSALSRSRRSDRAGVLSTVIGSKLFGSQARFKYFDGSEHNALAASVQTRVRIRDSERRVIDAFHARPRQGTPRVTVETMGLFGTRENPRRVAELLAKERMGSLKVVEERELESSVAEIEEFIIKNADTQRIPIAPVPDAV